MAQATSGGSSWRSAGFALVGIVIVLVAAAAYTSMLIAERQHTLREVGRYQANELIARAALEVARLHAAVASAAVPGSGVDEDEVRLRLDIVFNRIQTLQRPDVKEFAESSPEFRETVAKFAAAGPAWQAILDEAPSPQRLSRLMGAIAPLNAPLMRLAGRASTHGADLLARDQKELGDLFLLFSSILGLLALCSFGLVGALHWRNRSLLRSHQEVRGLMDEALLKNRILQERDDDLHIQNARFDAALNNMSQALCMSDAQQNLIVCNDRFLELFGVPSDMTLPGAPIAEIYRAIAENGRHDPDMIRSLWAEQKVLLNAQVAGKASAEDGAGNAISISQQPMGGGGWIATFEDISERRRAEARIRFMAHHDALTKLPNRAMFHERLNEALVRRRRQGDGLAILYLDLDRFKNVNDTLGHSAGDVLLEIVAQRLLECVRESDMVARLGGDEFAIILSGASRPEDVVETLAQRIVQRLADPYDINGHRAVIGASVGIAIVATEHASAEGLMKSADLALYRAKADGRGIYRFFESSMDAEVQARRDIELDLREALVRNELEVFYQPLINLQMGCVSGFEALLRWRHPERGLISPARFIPIAEELGLIVPIGAWVLAQACLDAASWPVNVKVAVNLSPVQFGSPGLVATVREALEAAALSPLRLELEITESALLTDSEAVLKTLHELRGLGLRTALDDFGTGYSSLSYLRSFPFDKIKIDQSFVREMGSRPDCLAIVESVAGLARKLGMTTTAEGVETEEQLAKLRTAGCTEVQGYLFDRPRPVTEIQRWFVSNDSGRSWDAGRVQCQVSARDAPALEYAAGEGKMGRLELASVAGRLEDRRHEDSKIERMAAGATNGDGHRHASSTTALAHMP